MLASTARKSRLSAYSALAGGIIPAAAASAAFVTQTDLNISVDDANSPVAIDFGEGYGDLFLFSVYSSSTSSFYGSPERGLGGGGFSFFRSGSTSVNVQFNPENSGGWSQASVIRYSSSGSQSRWPARLSTGQLIGPGADWVPMNGESAYEHLLAGRTFFSSSYSSVPSRVGSTYYTSSTYGQFANERGFLGLRVFGFEGEAELFFWLDVEVNLASAPARSIPGLTVNAWGFDSDNLPIRAGLPTPGAGALAVLAMGAAGIRRTRRSVTEAA